MEKIVDAAKERKVDTFGLSEMKWIGNGRKQIWEGNKIIWQPNRLLKNGAF
jgi:hypothetical protein